MQVLELLAAMLLATALNPTQQDLPVKETGEEVIEMKSRKLTPILLSDDVQGCVDFWSELGFTAAATIPGENGLGFAMLTDGTVEIMYQSFELARSQNASAIAGINRSMIYLEVDSIEAVSRMAADYEVVVPLRTTDYGALEIYLRDPGGNVIGFAQQAGG